MPSKLMRFYRTPALSAAATQRLGKEVERYLPANIEVATEWGYYLRVSRPLTEKELATVHWLLAETFEPENFGEDSFLPEPVVEIGPRLNFETSWATNAVSILRSCGVEKADRIERSLRISLPSQLTPAQKAEIVGPLYDRMTQTIYQQPLESFDSGSEIAPVRAIPVLEEGPDVLRLFSREMGIAWDDQDIEMIHQMYVAVLKRNPTDVELFQIGQANSEHSRHPYFKGRLVIDGVPVEESLIDIVKTPWRTQQGNSLVAFADDSSVIRGGEVLALFPEKAGEPSPLILDRRILHPTFTAETHNHPSGIEPYEGAATGSGGRIRDQHVTGRGALIGAGAIGYCVGNLHIPGYRLPWEEGDCTNPSNMAPPLQILIRASDGASDYGNCFGEPLIIGFTRTYADEKCGWIKPIVYAAGSGQIDDRHLLKGQPEKGMLVVRIGGPAYRIGLGGGSASSMMTGENVAELDFNSVQRGDPEMEQKLNRVVRACVELGSENPIVSVHDLGAGGDCNAIPEIVYPAGARINLRAIPVGDNSLSILEIWGNESQERNCLLIWPERLGQVQAICQREGTPCAVVGEVTVDGWFVVEDTFGTAFPVNLPLREVLGETTKKTFELGKLPAKTSPLKLPGSLTVVEALDGVLRMPSVGSKRYLTSKVDRSVGGLVAQQQCVGPNQLPLSDFAITAQSHFGDSGVAVSIGEQPIKGLISSAAMARMAVAEALLNMAGVKITGRANIRCSANWMWAAKLPGEGARLYEAAVAMRDIMLTLGIAVDGGKDSLSMAVRKKELDGQEVTIKSPGQLVIGAYAPVGDVTCKATPDLKRQGNSLLFVDLALGKNRLGGSALAQVYRQIGDESPDVEEVKLLATAFDSVQELLARSAICSLHDRSDGGLITTLLEMAFAGNIGLTVDVTSEQDTVSTLFSEELGLVLECENGKFVRTYLQERGLPTQLIGTVGENGSQIMVKHNGVLVLDEAMTKLRSIWESTSTQIDRLQADPECVDEEAGICGNLVTAPPFNLTFDPKPSPPETLLAGAKPKVAILREEGSNGDREMGSAFYAAGFEPWDVLMRDIGAGRVSLANFQGIAAVGGFSFKDVFDAGKGWAGVIRFNERIRQEFTDFYQRPDTFSLGVCNGCQLMALLGWAPWVDRLDQEKPRFIRNRSGRFESRFVTVKVLPSYSIFLQGMEGSRLGIWVDHGEGRLHVPKEDTLKEILDRGLAPLRFVDASGVPTSVYPYNPNGSPIGIAGLCSIDGRHLAIMPHPERLANKLWQWPWLPEDWVGLKASPWLRLFQNAYSWCRES